MLPIHSMGRWVFDLQPTDVWWSTSLKHSAVAEAGVVGRPDELRGEVITTFIMVKQGYTPGEALKKELLDITFSKVKSSQ